jgi:colanic acid biosynthesis glycosyl transferase WcaI
LGGQTVGRSLLIVAQAYPPDPTAVGQYLADVGEALAERGWQVRVLTADRGYDDPATRYPAREVRNGVAIRRLPFSSTGKHSLAMRATGQLAFLVQVIGLALLTCRRGSRLLVSTSPPMAALVALLLRRLRGVRYLFWVMDVNPEQAVVMGMARPGSLAVRLLAWLNRQAIAEAERVVTLDGDMSRQLRERGYRFPFAVEEVPLWPLREAREVPAAENPFLAEHGLAGKILVLYSGNHSLVHPLDTLLEAARELREEPGLVFGFVGGGRGKARVEEFVRAEGLTNCLVLPYQPLERLGASLSAGAIHVASMGESMVGLVHPSKCYGAMALGRPLLLIGPAESHFGRLVRETGLGWQVEHGDGAGLATLLRELARNPGEIERRGAISRQVLGERFAREKVLARLCERLEAAPGTVDSV